MLNYKISRNLRGLKSYKIHSSTTIELTWKSAKEIWETFRTLKNIFLNNHGAKKLQTIRKYIEICWTEQDWKQQNKSNSLFLASVSRFRDLERVKLLH